MDESSASRQARGRGLDTTASAALDAGREAFRARAWAAAYARLQEAAPGPAFQPLDLERLAIAAYLSGHDEASEDAWVRAHQAHLRANDPPRAVRCAFWLVMQLLSLRESARAGGWLATAQRLLAGCEQEGPEHGLMFVLEVRGHLRDGDAAAAQEQAARAAAIAARQPDADLKAFSLLTQGLVSARHGRWAAASMLFDEVMVAVTVDDVSPIAVGIVYCAVIEACFDSADIARAREWTDVLSRWCRSQPDLVAFRGHCAVHRAETLRFGGAWSDAMAEAEQVCCRAADSDTATASWRGLPIAAAFYEIAELHRMRGEFARADQAYREASRRGRIPEPGLSLLRLAQGRQQSAAASISRALEVPLPPLARAAVLAAGVEVAVAGGDLESARQSADELAELAGRMPAPFLRAVCAHASGMVRLAQGNPRDALPPLREAWMEWQSLEVPYEAARVRLLMAVACRALGDLEASAMECDAARRVFLRLGAAPGVTRADAMLGSPSGSSLTPRELEIVKLLATGRTNRAIARALGISERTVDRHVSNILTKLDLSSRTAAAAYAYEHGLV